MSEPHQEGDGATPGPSWCGAPSPETPGTGSLSPRLPRPELVSRQKFPARGQNEAPPGVETPPGVEARPQDEAQPRNEAQPQEAQPEDVAQPKDEAPPQEAQPDHKARHQREDLPRRRTAEKGMALLSAAVLLLGTAVAVGWSSASAEPAPELAAAEPAETAPAPPQPAAAVAPVPEAPAPAPAPAPDQAAAAPETPDVMVDRAPSPPRRVSIARLKIDTPLINLGLLKDGQLEVPAAFDIAGWHSNGVAPGDIGPAVIVGHVDSYEGPGIFYRVRELKNGEKITVDRADGSQVVFEVYGKETVPKDSFPTDKVYGDTEGAELRLLTCGGRFNKKTKSYTDNVLVYARQVAAPVPV